MVMVRQAFALALDPIYGHSWHFYHGFRMYSLGALRY